MVCIGVVPGRALSMYLRIFLGWEYLDVFWDGIDGYNSYFTSNNLLFRGVDLSIAYVRA